MGKTDKTAYQFLKGENKKLKADIDRLTAELEAAIAWLERVLPAVRYAAHDPDTFIHYRDLDKKVETFLTEQKCGG